MAIVHRTRHVGGIRRYTVDGYLDLQVHGDERRLWLGHSNGGNTCILPNSPAWLESEFCRLMDDVFVGKYTSGKCPRGGDSWEFSSLHNNEQAEIYKMNPVGKRSSLIAHMDLWRAFRADLQTWFDGTNWGDLPLHSSQYDENGQLVPWLVVEQSSRPDLPTLLLGPREGLSP